MVSPVIVGRQVCWAHLPGMNTDELIAGNQWGLIDLTAGLLGRSDPKIRPQPVIRRMEMANPATARMLDRLFANDLQLNGSMGGAVLDSVGM